MKLHRFIGDFDLSKKPARNASSIADAGGEVKILNPENINQIKNVLRLKKDDKIVLSNGKGAEAEAIITSISSNEIICVVNEIKKPADTEDSVNARKVNLYLAILKKENFELAVQKAVECGVSSITPIITERTIKTGLNVLRLEKIILEASEQCGRTTLPELFEIFDFSEAINSHADEKIIFHTGENTKNYSSNKKANSVNIFIGPEGGFTEKEIELAKNSGFTVASLGPLTLRGETAAIVATYRAVQGI